DLVDLSEDRCRRVRCHGGSPRLPPHLLRLGQPGQVVLDQRRSASENRQPAAGLELSALPELLLRLHHVAGRLGGYQPPAVWQPPRSPSAPARHGAVYGLLRAGRPRPTARSTRGSDRAPGRRALRPPPRGSRATPAVSPAWLSSLAAAASTAVRVPPPPSTNGERPD